MQTLDRSKQQRQPEQTSPEKKNRAAQLLGRLGGEAKALKQRPRKDQKLRKETIKESEKKRAAEELGRLGGKARAQKLGKKRLSEAMTKASHARKLKPRCFCGTMAMSRASMRSYDCCKHTRCYCGNTTMYNAGLDSFVCCQRAGFAVNEK
jgi:hypothetical protein